METRRLAVCVFALVANLAPLQPARAFEEWPSFRGPNGAGVVEAGPMCSEWNADPTSGELENVLWSIEVPGLGHSSPVISGNRVFLTTAIPANGEADLKVGRGGEPDAAEDGLQSWVVLCYDRSTGEELWRRVAHEGVPRATRHRKATQANATVTVSGERLVAFFGSEGLHCYGLDGEPLWSRDLGVIDVGKYGIGWGFASSPAIHDDRIALVCDDAEKPFVTVLSLPDGAEVWRRDRQEVCERSWGSPLIVPGDDRNQMVVNGWPSVVSYNFDTGDELWRITGGGDNPVPTPFLAEEMIYITSSHGGESPIYAVRPEASGDLTPGSSNSEAALTQDATEVTDAPSPFLWKSDRGGSYMSTPVVYQGLLYLGGSKGVIRSFDAKTGAKVYQKRLGGGAAIISSLVATDGKVYFASENGVVYVVAAGREYNLLSKNPMPGPCYATPAIASRVLYFRTTTHLIAIE